MGVIKFENGAPSLYLGKTCIGCWHCAAICPQRAFIDECVDLYPTIPEDALEKLVCTRRAIRHFKPDPPAKEVIRHVLECTAWAPAGMNRKTNSWAVLYGRNRVETLTELVLNQAKGSSKYDVLKNASEGNLDLLTCKAPCIIFGINQAGAINAETDTVIATATAELLLVQQGIGTCWGGYLKLAVEGCPGIGDFLNIPDGYSVYSVLLIGIPEKGSYRNVPHRQKQKIEWIC